MATPRLLPGILSVVFTACILACDGTSPLAPGEAPDGITPLVSKLEVPQNLPFHGATAGGLVGMVPAPEGRCPMERPILLIYEGAGTATHLGRFTIAGTECALFDMADPSTLMSGEGRYVFTAANGDQLFVAYDRTTIGFEPPPSPRITWSTSAYATGGTGRFENAELVDVIWRGGANLMTYETWSSIDGWIRYDASDRALK